MIIYQCSSRLLKVPRLLVHDIGTKISRCNSGSGFTRTEPTKISSGSGSYELEFRLICKYCVCENKSRRTISVHTKQNKGCSGHYNQQLFLSLSFGSGLQKDHDCTPQKNKDNPIGNISRRT